MEDREYVDTISTNPVVHGVGESSSGCESDVADRNRVPIGLFPNLVQHSLDRGFEFRSKTRAFVFLMRGGPKEFRLRNRAKDEWEAHDLNLARALALTSSQGTPVSG
jgi:hypothetical protein